MNRASVTRSARRDVVRLTGGRSARYLSWLATAKHREERHEVRQALHVARDPERWDERMTLRPVTGWDVT